MPVAIQIEYTVNLGWLMGGQLWKLGPCVFFLLKYFSLSCIHVGNVLEISE